MKLLLAGFKSLIESNAWAHCTINIIKKSNKLTLIVSILEVGQELKKENRFL